MIIVKFQVIYMYINSNRKWKALWEKKDFLSFPDATAKPCIEGKANMTRLLTDKISMPCCFVRRGNSIGMCWVCPINWLYVTWHYIIPCRTYAFVGNMIIISSAAVLHESLLLLSSESKFLTSQFLSVCVKNNSKTHKANWYLGILILSMIS